MSRTELIVHRQAGALGAEVRGVDLAAGLTERLVSDLRALWLAHGVLFFRGQDALTPQGLAALARRFGEPVEYPFLKGLSEAPEVIVVAKLEQERVNFGGVWHTDTAYLEAPPMGTMLLARETPPYGGDTLFASGEAAFAALSLGMQELLTGLRAVNSSSKADVTKTREDRLRDAGRAGEGPVFEAVHPVVRTHPETGRRSLYVNFAHTTRFDGMTEAESVGLLAYLFDHQTRPEFTCRFSWRPGSLAWWDNRCCLHNPVNDYHGHRRVMHRVSLAGDAPR
ncbi:MAG TPA: TauD/TfdA family dioxygenase [Phenylobacterium sp.]|jgi:taurine dioxygenase